MWLRFKIARRLTFVIERRKFLLWNFYHTLHFYLLHRSYGVDRCMPAGSIFVRSCVRSSVSSVTKCTIMYNEQTVEPKSVIFLHTYAS